MDDLKKKLSELESEDFADLDLDGIDEIIPEEKEQPTPTSTDKDSIMQDSLGGISTFVDIVFAIDCTGSMTPIINTVKGLTLDFYDELVTNMKEKHSRIVKQLRVKVIGFRDYYCDGDQAMLESRFFTLPDEKKKFCDYVNSLSAKGGGDEPENALEAMALAMRSDWAKVSDPNTERARNVVVLFTDASAHPLEKSQNGKPDGYPADMLKNYSELYEAWCGQGKAEYSMDTMAERLIVFAPQDSYPWSDIADQIENAAVVPIAEAKGGAGLGRDVIVNTISGSLR